MALVTMTAQICNALSRESSTKGSHLFAGGCDELAGGCNENQPNLLFDALSEWLQMACKEQ
jgi:hypothetical protein